MRTTTGAGAESSDSTLAAGRAALDDATRNILEAKKGTAFLSLPSGEEKLLIISGHARNAQHYTYQSLAKPETLLLMPTLRSCVGGYQKRLPLGLTWPRGVCQTAQHSLYSWRPGVVVPAASAGFAGQTMFCTAIKSLNELLQYFGG